MNGLRGLEGKLRRLLAERVLERFGETSKRVGLDELGLARDGYHDYEPSGWRSFQRAMKGIEVSETDCFLDIGCGKGRIVAQAARRPFGRVLGVELSEELAAQAQRLLEREPRRRRCGSVEIVVADSTSWQVPDEVTVIYFYNALSGSGLQAILDRIAESASRAPRDLSVRYVNPIHEHDVLAHPAFELRRRRGRRSWSVADPRRVSVFAVRPRPPATRIG